MNKIKNGSTVIVISGKYKGAKGKIISVFPQKNRVVIEGLNIVKKHVKSNPNKGIDGGISKKEASIHISNVSRYNPVKKSPGRIGVKFLKDGKKVHYFKSDGEVLN